ncbi:MAG: tyrosine transporter [Gammaproteobacteria bacterium]|nr:tyrosine transporter [Gammaproteobacteria bacterium]
MQLGRVIGAAFLVAGTCIGAGMLALPVATAGCGFFYSIILLVAVWAVMYYTGLLVLEANINLPAGANFISMSKATLGKAGEGITWVSYLLLLYSLMAAYLSGAGDLLAGSAANIFNVHLTAWFTPIPLLLLVGIVIYCGARFVDYLGRALLFGLIAAYVILFVIALPHIHFHQLSFAEPRVMFSALTIAATSFGYHITIPSLRVYLRDDIKKLKLVILGGSLIPLVVYVVWEMIVFGIIPIHGGHGLLAIFKSGDPATKITQSLAALSHSGVVTYGAEIFIAFAIASSFLGVAFSLFDFLSDGFAIDKTVAGKALLALITFVPPFVFVLLYPKGFILALSYAGIFVAILHGILPALMVWRGRKEKIDSRYKVVGGRGVLLLIILISVLIIASQVVINI